SDLVQTSQRSLRGRATTHRGPMRAMRGGGCTVGGASHPQVGGHRPSGSATEGALGSNHVSPETEDTGGLRELPRCNSRRPLRRAGALKDSLESRVRRKSQARFGRGRLEKDCIVQHLAGRLPYYLRGVARSSRRPAMSDLPGRPRRRRQETRQLWTERLARFSASTLSVAAFCAAEGVSPNSLFYWKRRLGTDPSGPAAPVISDGSPTFVPVRLHATA